MPLSTLCTAADLFFSTNWKCVSRRRFFDSRSLRSRYRKRYAEISVVDTLGSPKRLNRSSVTSRMRSAVRRGFFAGVAMCVVRVSAQSSINHRGVQWREPPVQHESRGLPTIAAPMPAISFQNVSKIYLSARGEVHALGGVSFDIEPGEFFGLLG